MSRDPKMGRGTRIFNIRHYESSKIQTLEVGRDQIKFENQALRLRQNKEAVLLLPQTSSFLIVIQIKYQSK